ncbi:MAG: GTPase ObgE [Firmicutes bacterium]|nr:GTPase ObgE [Bacillota bacterium]
MFLDKVTITIKAGNGGNGHVSFFRDKLTMKGGPDGGDGGRGGDIIFVGTTRVDNLIDFRFNKKFYAEAGANGSKRHRSGATGKSQLVYVPLGTKIYKINNENKELLADIIDDEQQFVALRGGAGGKGNNFFATSKKQTPNFSQTGIITKEYQVILELNSIADVGLVGFPNAGKSTLLSMISRSNPKIASYPFTTLSPNIAVTNILDQNIIVADIPGLIEGASQGIGLGHDFLKHLTRTRVLIHVIDASEQEGRTIIDDYNVINKELSEFSNELANKPRIIALNKCDIADPEVIKNFRKKIKSKYPIFEIIGAINQGVVELVKYTASILKDIPKLSLEPIFTTLEEQVNKNEFHIRMEIENTKSGEEKIFIVEGPLVENLIRGVVLTDSESNHYFQRRLVQSGIIDALKNAGMTQGSIVHVGEVEFEFVE